MKKKSLIFGGILVVGIGIGIFAIFKSSGTSSGGDEDEAPPENVEPVVTVQTATLKRMTLHAYVNGYGAIEAAPATPNESAAGGTLAAPGAGIVAKVNVAVGQHVEKGDILVEMNSATVTFEYALAELERQKKLFEQQNTSQKNLQDAEAQLASLEIVAPVSGTVTRLKAKVGQSVDANAGVAEVIDLNRLAVNAKISATDADSLKTGDDVEILSKPSVVATLSVVSPEVDPNDGTVSIWGTLPPGSGLKPGEFLPLKIITATHVNCLATPEESVVTDVKGQSVIALVHGDQATQTPVKTGLRENGWVEVESPELQEGNSVVTVGAYGLPGKTKIQIVNSSDEMSNSPAAQ